MRSSIPTPLSASVRPGDAAGSGAPMVVLATAHPAKFPAAIEQAVGRGPDVPARLAAVAELPERFDVRANDLAVIESYILERTRV